MTERPAPIGESGTPPPTDGTDTAPKAQNHYATLGLWRDASEAEIRRAYRRLVRLHHPDVSAEPDAGERFRAIQEAYDILSDPAARASLDASLDGEGPGRRPTRSGGTRAKSTGSRRQGYGDGVARGWTPPPTADWDVGAWIKEHYSFRESLRGLSGEVVRAKTKIALALLVLAIVICICALINAAVPGIGTYVAIAFFAIPCFILFFRVLFAALGPNDHRPHSERRG